MNDAPFPAPDQAIDLDMITTQWSELHDSQHFMTRYAPAVRRYLEVLLKNPQDADDVAQGFFLRVLERGLESANPARGRFRDYLKIGVRNAALSFLRQKKRRPRALDGAALQALSRAESAASQEWLREWQRCLLDRAWKALAWHQHLSKGNLFYSVLRAAVDHPEDDSAALARRVAELAGRPLSPEAFRKQLSRGRQMFAAFLICEVKQTLTNPTAADVEEELIAIGLREYVQPYAALGTS